MSNETFHSGFRVLNMVGVDCLASPNVTTKYCTTCKRSRFELSLLEWCSLGRSCHLDLWLRGCVPNETIEISQGAHEVIRRLHDCSILTRITETLRSRGLVSADRRGLVLLLCPGVDDALLAERCELNRWGNANRTIADVHKSENKLKEEEKKDKKSVGRVACPPPGQHNC